MNIFDKAVADEYANDTKLGMPSTDEGHFARRLALMERITGGKGFRTQPKLPAVRANGKTRGEMKRGARERANAKVSESRHPEFMHSSARQRVAGFERRPVVGFLATMQAAA
ncbi:hypothetical protein HFN71_28495 [Rhizobium laguerreae]|uniref:hypothetical protein n=1 Tax=Rhizobium laguerreae TaxID=1076926 RepID=UPI001C8FF865|nr:hypothetical protein [Rhizobium laguerreae]MBY3543626.1 hypothetical protein [Rhizobium laguerreae]